MNRRRFLQGIAVTAGLGWIGGTPKRTAAAQVPGDSPSFCFCAVADPHTAEAPKPGLERYGSGVDKLEACIRAMETMEAADKPDFILLLGDLHPDALKLCLPQVKIPIHATPGNHESDQEKRKQLRVLFPNDFKIGGEDSDYYSFIHKGVRFIAVCDAGQGGEHVGQFCSQNIVPSGQCEWIEKELDSEEPKKILFAHIPTERNGEDRDMFLGRNDSRWFNKLVAEKQPTAMFFGHLHRPTEEYRIGQTRVFQLRSCCWNFDRAPIGFLHVRVTPEGIVTREILTGECQ